MQVAEHIHALRIPFKVSAGPNTTLDRFVYAWLVYGKETYLIDAGVSSSETVIFEYMRKTKRNPREISMLIQTHSHPDHIGGSLAIRRASGCRLAAHPAAKPLIEDMNLQYKKRPSPSLFTLVGGSVKVDLILRDGDRLDLGNGLHLRVIHTPGHSKGSISLLLEEDGALFCGDAIPVAGEYPIYDDVLDSIKSIQKLKEIQGLKVLLPSWLDPQYGDKVYQTMNAALHHMQNIHDTVRKESRIAPYTGRTELCSRIVRRLGFPETPNCIRSIEAHLTVADCADLLKIK